ncbi:GtrA family protein [Lapillicoccus sp.]|jgi:putative flippase GtrA|uniref:GtrA family protein n=1 Tax=Lapillicoccus sp. TaxID=1909287 RepID=UPI0025D87A61|nr:GtrA family protein [Lapillicoccus sp.]
MMTSAIDRTESTGGFEGTRPSPAEAAPGRPRLGGQLARFATIGVASTVVNLGLFALLHAPLGTQPANVAALLVATVLNTAANRRWTFGVRGADGIARHHLQSLTIFAVTWAFSSGALALLAVWTPHASTTLAVLTVAAANVVSTAVRFVAMRTWIFRS